jgi:putative YhdH/YhfP family quinone oxidoreductase
LKNKLQRRSAGQPLKNFGWNASIDENGKNGIQIGPVANKPLNRNQVIIRVEFASLNYKDLLTASGKNGETKLYPQTIGVDAVGIVEDSLSSKFKVGDRVAQFSRGLGTTKGGGLCEYLIADEEDLIVMPSNLSSYSAMMIGTAGLTASACISKIIEQNISPGDGPILVTGARGGVGRLAIIMLSNLGFDVFGSSRGSEVNGNPFNFNSQKIIKNPKFTELRLLPEKWAASIDTLGGNALESTIKSTRSKGIVLSVGMVDSPNINLNVFPFILRGVTLAGVNLDQFSISDLDQLLRSAVIYLSENDLVENSNLIDFQSVGNYIEMMASGMHSGRTVVKVGNESPLNAPA